MPETSYISQASNENVEFIVNGIQFGNGYEQVQPDGINNIRSNWNVVWENVTTTQKTTIITALRATNGADYITWTPPGYASAIRFRTTGYSITTPSGNIWTITAQLKQVFDV